MTLFRWLLCRFGFHTFGWVRGPHQGPYHRTCVWCGTEVEVKW